MVNFKAKKMSEDDLIPEPKPESTTVQEATIEDVDQVTDLALELESELRDSWDPDRRIPPREELLQRYQSRIEDPKWQVILARKGDQPIGYIFGFIDPEKRQDTLWVQGVYTKPDSRDFITARRMFAGLEKFAKGKNIAKIGGQVYKNSRQHLLFKLVGCSDIGETTDGKEVIISKDLTS
mgnify:CR=1 FL=1